jgi:hypothetical protein
MGTCINGKRNIYTFSVAPSIILKIQKMRCLINLIYLSTTPTGVNDIKHFS